MSCRHRRAVAAPIPNPIVRLLACAALASLVTLLAGCSDPTSAPAPEVRDRPSLAFSIWGPSHHPWINRVVVIKNRWSGGCLDVPNGAAANGVAVQHYAPCHFGQSQQFLIRAVPLSAVRTVAPDSDYVALTPMWHWSLCLHVRGGTWNGSEDIELSDCHFGPSQEFAIRAAGDPFGKLILTSVTAERQALDVWAPAPNGVQQYPKHSGPSQQWLFFDATYRTPIY
jgi:hypothetical protein